MSQNVFSCLIAGLNATYFHLHPRLPVHLLQRVHHQRLFQRLHEQLKEITFYGRNIYTRQTRRTITFGSSFSSGGLRTFLGFDLFRLIGSFFFLRSGGDFDLAHVAIVVDDFLKD